MGDKDWEKPRRGELGSRSPRRPARRPRPVPPGATDPTELLTGAGHFDGVGFADEANQPTDVLVPSRRPTAPAPRRGRNIGAAIACTVVGLVSLLVLGVTGYAWSQVHMFDTAIHKSDALIGPTEKKSLHGDTNILIMGLDSRLDENGKPLPRNIYNALHAGDDSVGGYNANVLMLLHVPAAGRAVEISIPRDDYVELPGCPDGVCKEKIKQAYGLARDAAYTKLRAQGLSGATLEQRARDAGRKEEADTVSKFLGGVPIDHFIEVTLVAFFQIAQVVQPVTVCLLKPTHDTYSGANFRGGQQQINAAQALAFVRQRRDNVKGDFYYHNFTDLDRERRQQAFISSLAYQLRQAGTFTSPAKISGIIDVAKQNTAIDSGLDLVEFAQEASNLTGGHITFNTLPVDRFADLGGSIGDVNIVNVPVIEAEVKHLLDPAPAANPTPTTAPAAPPPPATGVVDVVNRSGQSGVAGRVEHALAGKGFTQGLASTESLEHDTVVEYGTSASRTAAAAVAGLLGGATVRHSSLAGSHVRVVLGNGFVLPTALDGVTRQVNPADLASEAPGSNPNAPSPLAGGSIPCVK
ncbi:MAG TPA: LCP family protein [Pseudonocardiaceae bacterium]|nr:LCP family protein [Pseudonocardiaceae bacterium]